MMHTYSSGGNQNYIDEHEAQTIIKLLHNVLAVCNKKGYK